MTSARTTLSRVSARTIVPLAALLVALALGGAAGGTRLPRNCPLPPAIESELIERAFTDSLHGTPLRYPAVTSLDDITNHLLDLLMPVALFRNAYANLAEVEHRYEYLDPPDSTFHSLSVSYVIGGRQYTAYAYFREAEAQPGRNAAVIIPGSGLNQSTAIYLNDPDNYHYNIGELVQKDWDTYVYVKPNEDFLAIHNGEKKLGKEYIINYLVNLGGSYSCRYIVDSMAIVKSLKTVYDGVVVIGLSQGGKAALYNSLQSHPDGAIIASGFSVLHERLVGAGLGQIVIPGVSLYLGSERVFEGIQNSDTKYLFSWGKKESGSYKVEAVLGCTRDFLAPLRNVTCISHAQGHVFPGSEVAEFLESFIMPAPGIAVAPVLFQNAPNPFVSATRIAFSIEKKSHVRLRVVDAKGRLVSVLVDDVRQPDLYVEEWAGRDDSGRPVPAGVYFYRLELPGWSAAKKMTVAR